MIPPIPMCHGHYCLLKEVCYRFTAKPGQNQEYFDKSPIKMWINTDGLLKGRNFLCEEFWVLSSKRAKCRILSDRIKDEDSIAFR